MTDWYTASGNPTQGSAGASNVLRSEYNSIATAFSKMPALTGYGGLLVGVNGSGTALQTYSYAEIASALTFVNLEYTGTLTGSTGIINIGSGQLYKDSSGNVGIGTSSPGAKLTIAGGTLPAPGFGNIGMSSQLTTGQTGTFDTGTLSSISNNLDASSLELSVGSTSGYETGISLTGKYATNYQGAIRFLTASTEAMRIDSSGNVGIGTSSPGAKLAISNAGAQGLEFGYSSGLSANFIQSINRSTNADVDLAYYLAGGSGAHKFYTASTEKMRIDASGNVGIGTTTPNAKLDVNGSISIIDTASTSIGERGIVLVNDSTNDYLNIWNYGNNVYAIQSADDGTYRDLSLSPLGGKVGIGTTAPTEVLDVNGYIKTSSGIKFPDNTTQTTAGGLGVGQTWQDVTASRASATTYTNSTGRPIFVIIKAGLVGGSYNMSVNVTVDGVNLGAIAYGGHYDEGMAVTAYFIVPPGKTYSATIVNYQKWFELR